jgi:hypothetical protein
LQAPGGVEGKYFYPTAEQATALARANFPSQGVQTLVTARVPNAVLGQATRIAPFGEGPAYFFEAGQLPALGSPAVQPFFPIFTVGVP